MLLSAVFGPCPAVSISCCHRAASSAVTLCSFREAHRGSTCTRQTVEYSDRVVCRSTAPERLLEPSTESIHQLS